MISNKFKINDCGEDQESNEAYTSELILINGV